MRFVALALLAACGGKPAPPKPKPEPAKALATLLHDDFAMLGEVAHRLKGRCQASIDELGPLIARMKDHEIQVKAMLEDTQDAAALKKELATYAEDTKGKSDAIAQDLGATFVACGQLCTGTCEGGVCRDTGVCKERYELERLIAGMPTY